MILHTDQKFDVAFSCVVADRSLAEEIAVALRKQGARVFFDSFEEAEAWGSNLHQRLQRLYDDTRLCIVLLSEDYLRSHWAAFELRNLEAHARDLESFGIVVVAVGGVSNRLPQPHDRLLSMSWPETGAEEIAQAAMGLLKSLPTAVKKPEPENYHVIKRESGWSVKRSGASRASSIHSTQEEAIAAAREVARRQRASELIVHRQDGTVRLREPIAAG